VTQHLRNWFQQWGTSNLTTKFWS